MALDPTPTETIEWATTEGVSGPNTGIPDTAAQQHGWPAAPATPVRTWFNYWMRAVWVWIQWLVGAIPRKASFTAAEWAALTSELPVGIYRVKTGAPSPASEYNLFVIFGASGGMTDAAVGFAIRQGFLASVVFWSGTAYTYQGSVPLAVASTSDAQAGTSNSHLMTAERTRQAVAYNGLRASGTNAFNGGWTEIGAGPGKIILTEWGFSQSTGSSDEIKFPVRANTSYGAVLIPVVVSSWAGTTQFLSSSNGAAGAGGLLTVKTTDLSGSPFLDGKVYWTYTMILTVP